MINRVLHPLSNSVVDPGCNILNPFLDGYGALLMIKAVSHGLPSMTRNIVQFKSAFNDEEMVFISRALFDDEEYCSIQERPSMIRNMC